MDPRRLLTFRSVARERSFSDAARALRLSQPSVSQQIALLETEIGVRLFERGRGGLRLTPAGDVLLVHADRIAWRLELAQQQIAELATDRREQIRLGAFPTALAGFVPDAVARLQAEHHDLHVTIREVTPSNVHEPLLNGELDIALSYQDSSAPRREHDDARRIDLARETFVLAMPHRYPQAKGKGKVKLTDFASADWVVPSREGFIIQACRDAGFEPHVVAVSPDPLATRGMIARGIAIGLVPSLLAEAYTDVVLRPVAGDMPTRDIFALIPPGEPHPRASDVVAALQSAADALDL